MISRRDILVLIIVLIISVINFFLFLNKRPFTDEGSYCTIAQRISKGSILYKDIYNEKSPLPYLLASIFINTSSNPIIPLRILSYIFLLISLFLLYLLIKGNKIDFQKRAIVVIFFLITAPLFQSFNYTSEILALPLILFIFWQIKRDNEDKINYLTGLLIGLLFFIKQPFILFALTALFFSLFSKNIRKYIFTGFILTLILVFIILKLKGIFEPFVENLLFSIKRYDIKSYLRLPYQNEYYQFILTSILTATLFYGSFVRIINASEFFSTISLLIAGVVRMDAFKLLPFFALSIAILSRDELMNKIKNISLILIALSIFSIVNYKDILNQNFDGIRTISYTIEAKTDENESIWVAPHEANIYCLSKRRPSSKYFFLLPWIDNSEVLLRLKEDLIKNDPPECIIDVSQFNNATDFSLKRLFPEFDKIVSLYKDIQEINGAMIYCKR